MSTEDNGAENVETQIKEKIPLRLPREESTLKYRPEIKEPAQHDVDSKRSTKENSAQVAEIQMKQRTAQRMTLEESNSKNYPETNVPAQSDADCKMPAKEDGAQVAETRIKEATALRMSCEESNLKKNPENYKMFAEENGAVVVETQIKQKMPLHLPCEESTLKSLKYALELKEPEQHDIGYKMSTRENGVEVVETQTKAKRIAQRVGVVTNPRLYLTPERAEIIQQKISYCIMNRLPKHFMTLPRFKGNPILKDNGVIYFECWDGSSLQKLRQYFKYDEESVYNRLHNFNFSTPHIEFELEKEIPKLVKCSITVASCSKSVWEVHCILRAQNEDYKVNEWFYHSSVGKGTSSSLITVTYYVPEGIVAKIQENDSELSYGFGCVFMDVHKERA